jgi:hypothetical protein
MFNTEVRAALDRFGGLCDRLENLIAEAEGSVISARVEPAGPSPKPVPASGPTPYGELLNIVEETRSALRSAGAPATPAQ